MASIYFGHTKPQALRGEVVYITVPNKIALIKAVRATSKGISLKEAKDIVEGILRTITVTTRAESNHDCSDCGGHPFSVTRNIDSVEEGDSVAPVPFTMYESEID